MRAIQPPKYNPNDVVIVYMGKSNWNEDEIRGAIVQSVWYDHRNSEWNYNVTEGQNHFMNKGVKEKDILDLYSAKKMIHYINKGL